ncbi:MAG: DUF6249 domain-containing protein [Limnohabitans sp.]
MDSSLLIPLAGLAVPLLALCIPILYLVLRHAQLRHRAQQVHETIRQLAQLGQPIPPELLKQEPPSRPDHALTPEARAERVRGLLRKGVMAISAGVGLGLVVFLVNLEDGRFTGFHGWAWGLLPCILGLGWLILWRIESRQLQRERAAEAFAR